MSSSQTILITGATAGIGRNAALYLARRGHRVIATGRKQTALDDLRKESGGTITTLTLDVTSAASIQAAAREVDQLTRGQGVDVLINNAGYGQAAPVAELTDADLRMQFETNVFGLHAVTRAFLPKMMARRSGKVINISSVGGRVTFPVFGAYHATKYAVEALSDSLRMEMRPFGVKVVLVEPGPIATEFANRSMAEIERYKNPSSPYAQIYARADEIRKLTDKQSVPAERVSRVITRAVEKKNPAPRYVVPFSSRLMLWFLERLPTALVDWVMARVLGLTPKLLAAPRADAHPAATTNKAAA